jgi:beta-glucosidase
MKLDSHMHVSACGSQHSYLRTDHASCMRPMTWGAAALWLVAVSATPPPAEQREYRALSCDAPASSQGMGTRSTIKTDGTPQPKVPVSSAFANEDWYKKAAAWVAQASRADKEALVSGLNTSWNNVSLANPNTLYVGNVVGVAGLPPLSLQDSGNGFRPMTPEIRSKVFSWPGAGAVASTWSAELGEAYGRELAEGHLEKGANVLLGPGVNLWLFPKGGRNGEMLTGEMPFLGHQLALHAVRGLQGPPTQPTGLIATAKHLTAYNMEADRLTMDSKVSDELLEAVFFPPFFGAIEAGVGSIMCSYNFVNSVPACANDAITLLKSYERQEWPTSASWPGFVMSDWWAIYGKDYAATNLDMAMPGNDLVGEVNAFEGAGGLSGLADDKLDAMALRVAGTIHRLLVNSSCEPAVHPLTEESSCCERIANQSIIDSERIALARTIAAEAVVLLRNEDVGGKPALPFTKGTRVAVVGDACDPPPYTQAEAADFHYGNGFVIGGSGRVLTSADSYVTIFQGLQRSEMVASGGLVVEMVDSATARNASALRLAVAAVDAVIACGWTNSSEEVDAPSLELMVGGGDLLAALDASEAMHKPAIVLLSGRGPVLTPWRYRTAAMASLVYGGQEAGNGWADVLTGVVNPSGKLIFTMPRQDNQGPEPCVTSPTELVPCDYSAKVRELDLFQGAAMAHEQFGFGLSYTTFEYTELRCDGWNATLNVSNTGSRAGHEVVQLYVHHEDAPLTRGLAAFAKVYLEPGETISLSLGAHPLARRAIGSNGTLYELSSAEMRVGPLSCGDGVDRIERIAIIAACAGLSLLLVASVCFCMRKKGPTSQAALGDNLLGVGGGRE